jgi:hypothetical protein
VVETPIPCSWLEISLLFSITVVFCTCFLEPVRISYLLRAYVGEMRTPRQCAAYHIERSIASTEGLTEYPCACRACCGAKIRKFHTIARHHRKNGRDPFLPYPVIVSHLDQKLWFHIVVCFFPNENPVGLVSSDM